MPVGVYQHFVKPLSSIGVNIDATHPTQQIGVGKYLTGGLEERSNAQGCAGKRYKIVSQQQPINDVFDDIRP